MATGTGPISGATNIPLEATDATGAANLFYKDTFSASATQELDITVLGETATPQTPDEVIVQYVNLSDLNDVMSYTGTWSAGQGPTGGAGDQPVPHITVDFTPLLTQAELEGEMGALFRKLFAAGDSGCGTDDSKPLMRDYSGDESLWPIQTYFTNATFDYTGKVGSVSGLSATVLNSIPAEAVTKVEVQDLSCQTLHTAVNGNSNQNQTKEYVPTETLKQDAYVRQLFEQAAAAGKIDIGSQGTKFIDGDSITLYVLYTMTRTKKFLLDAVQGAGESGTAPAFKPLGLTTAIVDGETLESNPQSVLVAWQFVGKTVKGSAPSQAPQ